MPLKQFTVDFSELSQNETIRLWLPFVLPTIKYRYDKINNYLDLCESGKRPKGGIVEGNEGEAISLGGEQINVDGTVDLSKIPYVPHSFYERASKGKIKDEDILICKDGALTGKTCFVDFSVFPSNEVMINEHVYILRGNEKINQKFLFFFTTTGLFQSQVKNLAYRKKAQPGLNSDHFKKIKIPLIPKSIQDQIVAQIEPIEKKIKELKAQIKEPQEIISRVFAREFKFDLEKFEKSKKEKFFEVDFSSFDTPLIRSTAIQSSFKSKYLKQFLKNNTIFLKDVITKPIKRGKQPEYIEDGIKVIKTLNIQKGEIDFNETQFVSDDFLNKNKEKAGIYQNDLLLTSTGMGRGKFALYDDEEICFADSHVSIIRFNQEKILPYFLNYYCQSFFGTEQLKYIEMHIKGTPEIYETQLNYFQIPDISLKTQQKIVDEIKTELDKQNEIKYKIESERNRIDKIIEEAVT